MEENKTKDTRGRSRLYPRYDLEDAIKFIEVVSKMGGNRVSVDAVAAEMGKATTNSGFSGRVSSAKQFSLISLEGGKLSLTTLGKTIMFPPSDNEKEGAIKKAFTQPPLYQEIITSFRGRVVPERSALGNRLVHDYQIEAAAKDGAAKNFIDSAQYAGVIQNGILVISDSEEGVSVQNEITPENSAKEQPIRKNTSPAYDETTNFIFDLAGGIKLLIPKNQKTSEAIADGELKDARKSLSEFARKYLPEEKKENEETE